MDRVTMCQRLQLMGFRIEGILHEFGADRGNYLQFAFLLGAEEQPGEPVPLIVPAAEGVQAAPAV